MKDVNDRIVQYPNRYKLTNINNNEVLGTFDFDEVTGTVQQVGTEINAELFESIKTDLSSLFTNTTNLKNDSFASVEISGNTVTFKNKDGIVLDEFTIEQVHYDDATQSKSGLMSGPDKLKLDGIEDGAQVNTVEPTGTYSGMTVGNATNAENADNATNAESADKVNHALKISTDTETKTYDGSAEVSITIPQATEVKTSTEWESQNPVLGAGKFGYDSTNKITKIGDGVTAWNNLPFFLSTQKSFANATWEEINNLVINNAASIYYNVGDEKTISLSTGEEITLVILGFNHDDLSDGSGKAGITLGMKGVLSTLYPMNSSYTNAGGWAEMSLRTTLQTTIFNQLPDDLKPVIKSVTKRSIAGDRYTHTDTDDKLFLLSVREITGTDQYDSASHAEGSQYEYWLKMDGGTNADNRIKRNSVNNGVDYWTRTKYYGNTYAFAYISSSGDYQNFTSVTNNKYVSFCFCI